MDGDEYEADFERDLADEDEIDEDEDAPCVYTRRAEAAAQVAKAAALTTRRHKVNAMTVFRPTLHTVEEKEAPKHRRLREASA